MALGRETATKGQWLRAESRSGVFTGQCLLICFLILLQRYLTFTLLAISHGLFLSFQLKHQSLDKAIHLAVDRKQVSKETILPFISVRESLSVRMLHQ